MSEFTDSERLDIRKDFRAHVNLEPKQLEQWLETDESQSVGDTSGTAEESTGHKSGRRIVEIKRKTVDELTDDDYAWMRKVVNYIKRHTAQRPDGDVSETPWRFSLMNWGHDPLA
jgi:hypothetical protein